MAKLIFANNAGSLLAGTLTTGATVLNVTSGTGALFPQPAAGQYFVLSLFNQVNPAITEILWVTAVSTDSMTVVRAQEGTAALTWAIGDIANNDLTAGQMATMVQQSDLQAQASNYAADTGTANAYVVALSPVVTSNITGMPVRFKAAHASTGASTFNGGGGATTMTHPNGSAIGSGDVVAGAIYTTIFDGTKYQLFGTTRLVRVQVTHATAGSGTISIPSNAIPNSGYAWVTGGGGGAAGTSGSKCGGGGGAGATAEGVIVLTPGGTVSYVTGAVGAGGSAGSDGSNGGDSSLVSGATTFTGGKGFGGDYSADVAGGAGGTASGGSINTPGGDGLDGSLTSNVAPWACGGASKWGGGARAGAGGPAAAQAYGSGGGASYGTSSAAGGSGVAGVISLEYWTIG